MPYLIFGFAVGTFVCGLIEHFHKPEQAGWIKSSYLFGLSGIIFLIFIYEAWPLLVQVFSG
ncbi:hypothetical protein [Fodinibius halophilus]|uniref:Uncharacterized protein n=1 Tax=Fodinibius halophilus TaxID=1736908 RepID=A0A6M1TAY4_9BACT|nr:hypothetical protein [Fodinibius halophilus]NGP88114.1 hypothetical protein [Fodinibius halophilus]